MQENTDLQAQEKDSTQDLVDWKNPPKLTDLKQNLTDAQQNQQVQVTKINGWLDNLHVRGAAAIKGDGSGSKVVPPLIRKQAEWRYGALSEPFLSTEDVFNINPRSWEDTKAAEQNELLLNYQFNCLLSKQQLVDEVVRTGVDEGTIIGRVGWVTEEIEVEEEVPIATFNEDASYLEELQSYIQMQEQSPSDFYRLDDMLKMSVDISKQYGVPMRPTITGMEKKMVKKVVKNQPTVEICDFRNIIFDPTCMGVLSKARFVIHMFPASLDMLNKDGKYKNLDKIEKTTNSILGEPDFVQPGETATFEFKDDARKQFVVHEYWGEWDIDGKGTTKQIVAAWVGNTIIRLEENPFPDGKIPFVTSQYLPVRKSIYGEPDGALLETNQKVAGAVMRGMIDILGKSANAQTGMRKDMLDTTNKMRFRKGQDYEYNVGVDPRQGVFMHTFGEIPASAQYMLQLMQMEAESMTGVKAFDQGINASSMGDVAAGIRGALDAASKRELGILRRLSNFMVEIARKIIAMNAVFLSDQEVVRLTNEQFSVIDRDDLPGNFDLKVTVSTAEEDNNKAQELAFMLQTMGNTLPLGASKIMLGKLFKLRKMPDVAKLIETFEPELDPVQQEMAQIELQLKRAEVELQIAEIQKKTADAQLAMAKVQTEISKAGNIQADTDAQTLDFVETESGVKQARELEKQGAQARAQTETKVVSAGLQAQADERKFQQKIVENEQKAQHTQALERSKNQFVDYRR